MHAFHEGDSGLCLIASEMASLSYHLSTRIAIDGIPSRTALTREVCASEDDSDPQNPLSSIDSVDMCSVGKQT